MLILPVGASDRPPALVTRHLIAVAGVPWLSLGRAGKELSPELRNPRSVISAPFLNAEVNGVLTLRANKEGCSWCRPEVTRGNQIMKLLNNTNSIMKQQRNDNS
jgi:hypothetical protein